MATAPENIIISSKKSNNLQAWRPSPKDSTSNFTYSKIEEKKYHKSRTQSNSRCLYGPIRAYTDQDKMIIDPRCIDPNRGVGYTENRFDPF